KKTREEIAAAASAQLDEAKQQDNKIMIGRLAKFVEDLPQEDSIDQSILDLEQRIFAAAKPEKIKVSVALAGSTQAQAGKNPTRSPSFLNSPRGLMRKEVNRSLHFLQCFVELNPCNP
ncbi:MAG: hypothetical protein ACKOLA_00830, partial [Spartobacteria bacterium]